MEIFGIKFMNKEERAKAAKDFGNAIFPLGEEEQKAKVLSVLHEVCTGKIRDQELLYVYITSKDHYLSGENELDSLTTVMKHNREQRWVSNDNLHMIVTLIYLDSGISSLDSYPTADAVRTASQQYPITEYFN
ncbi:MAG: hypothetical protein LBN35_01285 [Clostridiales Family XIII bacterium]|jgi:hypothetical protein|nr:hypothetical protein [Clostridiales Family XIII bacterium]